MTNRNLTLALSIGSILVAAAGGSLIGHSIGQEEGRNADITVASCSAFAADPTPELPPYTFPGACAREDGTLSVPTNWLPQIDRCLNDDYNDGTQARCWTEDVTGKVVIISQDDKVIS